MMKSRYIYILLISFLGLLLIITFSCVSKERYAGKYVEQGEVSSKISEIELKENGQGFWRVQDDEISLTWNISHNELRLHTKSGGVIIGRMKDDVLEILLPGSKTKHFRRVK